MDPSEVEAYVNSVTSSYQLAPIPAETCESVYRRWKDLHYDKPCVLRLDPAATLEKLDALRRRYSLHPTLLSIFKYHLDWMIKPQAERNNEILKIIQSVDDGLRVNLQFAGKLMSHADWGYLHCVSRAAMYRRIMDHRTGVSSWYFIFLFILCRAHATSMKPKLPTSPTSLIIAFLRDLRENFVETMPNRFDSLEVTSCSNYVYLPPGHKYEYYEVCCAKYGTEDFSYAK